MAEQKPVLIAIDDEDDIARLVADTASMVGFDAYSTCSVEGFLSLADEKVPDVIVTDLCMPETDGIELIFKLDKSRSRAGVILMSGYDGRYIGMASGLLRGYQLHDLGNIQKPFRIDSLKSVLEQALTWAKGRDVEEPSAG